MNLYFKELWMWLGRKHLLNNMPFRDKIEYLIRIGYIVKAKLFPRRDYALNWFRASPTNVCNAACVFCTYPDSKMSGKNMTLDTLKKAMPLFAKNNQTIVDLGPNLGDPLVDMGLKDKVEYLSEHGYKSQFTTNGILLHKHIDWLFDRSKDITCLFFSIPSFDRDEYHLQYGVDKGDQLYSNIKNLLERNESLDQPLEINLMFRNREHPRTILNSPRYLELKKYIHGKVRVTFTEVWDNWSGALDFSKWSKHMLSKLRWNPQINRPCKQLRNALVISDGTVRLCGCRAITNEHDDLVVGTVDNSYETLNKNAAKIRDRFYTKDYPFVCTGCSFYTPE